MTRNQNIIRPKPGVLELARQVGNVSQSLQDDRVFAGSFLPLQGPLRDRR